MGASHNQGTSDSWDFIYNGDGTRVGQDNPDGTTTLFIAGGSYEVVIDSQGQEISVRKYYAIGGQRVMREDDANYYLLTEHLGSVVGIADGSGSLISEQRYMPYGLPRLEPGIGETDSGFSGQRSLDSVGMMDYISRWYIPTIGQFGQADNVWQFAGSRYEYVRGNPIRYTDPTGHYFCEGEDCKHNLLHTYTRRQLIDVALESYGVVLQGSWEDSAASRTLDAIVAVGNRLASASGSDLTGSEAFVEAYDLSSKPMILSMGCLASQCNGIGAFTASNHLINIASFAPTWHEDWGLRVMNQIAHELGHAFWRRMLALGIDVYSLLGIEQRDNPYYPNRVDLAEGSTTGPDFGFASSQGVYTWQMNPSGSRNEEFADQFLGWTFDTWADTTEGTERARWMDMNMPVWIRSAIGG